MPVNHQNFHELLYIQAQQLLNDIIQKLQSEENYEENKRLGQILVHYIELYRFKEKFTHIEQRLNTLIKNVLRERRC
jgi:hypothetical protein